jgi:hypothetical protein
MVKAGLNAFQNMKPSMNLSKINSSFTLAFLTFSKNTKKVCKQKTLPAKILPSSFHFPPA